MKKLTIHKRINVAKYIFNWQNTGRQKQLFEESQALGEERTLQCVGMCPLECDEFEAPQHFLQCTVLHGAKVIKRDFDSIKRWMKEKKTLPELSIIIEDGLVHWMKTGNHIKIWELQDTKYRAALETAIQAQNHIGWSNMLKGRLVKEWGDIQMKYFEEVYEEEVPKRINTTAFIFQPRDLAASEHLPP